MPHSEKQLLPLLATLGIIGVILLLVILARVSKPSQNVQGYAALDVDIANLPYANYSDTFFGEAILAITTPMAGASYFDLDIEVREPTAENFFVYKTGYYTDENNAWQSFTLVADNPAGQTGSWSTSWIRGGASKVIEDLNGNSYQPTTPGYVIVYTCREYSHQAILDTVPLTMSETNILNNYFDGPYGYICGFKKFTPTSIDANNWRIRGFTSPHTACTDTCSSLGYSCGMHTICGTSTNCGTCSSGTCTAGQCVEDVDLNITTTYDVATDTYTQKICSSKQFSSGQVVQVSYELREGTASGTICASGTDPLPSNVLLGDCATYSITGMQLAAAYSCNFDAGDTLVLTKKVDSEEIVSESDETNNEIVLTMTRSAECSSPSQCTLPADKDSECAQKTCISGTCGWSPINEGDTCSALGSTGDKSYVCQNGACVEEACVPSAEICNGIDDDCDGQIDEPTLGMCPSGQTCQAGQCTNSCTPSNEICDGIDNDCDGQVDEPTSGLCPAYNTCQSGTCVCSDTRTDAQVCGIHYACGTRLDGCGVERQCGTCNEPNPHCSPLPFRSCVECMEDSHCGMGQTCDAWQCVDGNTPDLDISLDWDGYNRLLVTVCSDEEFTTSDAISYSQKTYVGSTPTGTPCDQFTGAIPDLISQTLQSGECHVHGPVILDEYEEFCDFTAGNTVFTRWTIDVTNVVAESNEANNIAGLAITRGDPPGTGGEGSCSQQEVCTQQNGLICRQTGPTSYEWQTIGSAPAGDEAVASWLAYYSNGIWTASGNKYYACCDSSSIPSCAGPSNTCTQNNLLYNDQRICDSSFNAFKVCNAASVGQSANIFGLPPYYDCRLVSGSYKWVAQS